MCLLSFSVCASCGSVGGEEAVGRAYVIKGTVLLDSSWIENNKLLLYADNHKTLVHDSIDLTTEGTFQIERHTNVLDELYLCGAKGELCRFFASGDVEVNLSIVAGEDEQLKVQYLTTPSDSVNGWLQEQKRLFDNQPHSICRLRIDSLIRNYQNDVRVTLLLRDEIANINDSLDIRRSLGSIREEAKPDWLKKSIDATLKARGSGIQKNTRRLLNAAFETKDTIIDLASSRSDYMLVYFWADYSKPSIDSLRTLANLVSSQYDHKRVSFLSCCLHAEDSAMWRVRVNFLEGQHSWIKGGFSDARMRAWNIQQVPSVILMDMYCNQTQRDIWGGELRRALDRVPTRIGYQKK